ncbi:VirB4 family type IV secretion/conjugal transfer ATPase [Turicimonas muris]|uniref:Type IV secretion system protein virB4 n=3 Tax=Turicimonas muris TaxID=1796652 RepID=A0A227KNQ6_9BURK|nr:VirB4 family type IV secretion/conjugal transfer ATPase [Turicimonas muris]ANU66066.1 VirB4 family type IV secretion/conjugal transfer ATPase [Burkholderiales bacterium YL45]OXE49715.1 VirB4 family type IV secretion/conjugal transfer ATPase [Turicimonas muris]QQQ97217.1 VirB4 family type IV secretion/conjugal transfer ATPase [Turicimonas muris]
MFSEKQSKEKQEKSLSAYLPYSAVIAPGIVICKEGDLVATVKISGKVFEAVSNEDLQRDAERQNNFLKVMAGASQTDEISIKVHRIRRVIHDELSAPTDPRTDFVNRFISEYNRNISDGNLMATELYVTLVSHKANPLSIFTIFGGDKRKAEEIKEELDQRIEDFKKVFLALYESLQDYEPVILSEYAENGITYSNQLSFYNYLITGQWQKIRVPSMPLDEALGNVQIFVGSDTIEFQTALENSYAQSIELKDYPLATFSRILDGLLYNSNFDQSPYPFIETQTFTAMSKQKGLTVLKRQQNQLNNAEDDGLSQIRLLSTARDMVANGEIVVGEYCYSLFVFGDKEKVYKNANDVVKKLQDAGFLPVKSTLALPTSYLHQIPGCKQRPRVARITSMNFAHLAAFHNFPCGKRDRNPWGEAVALLKMPSNQPFYFNFHYTDAKADSFGEVPLGNTSIIGASGAGKTVLLNFLLFCAQKYRTNEHKLSVILFDKDKGAELAIRAMGGGYLTIENGVPSGINPFQLEPTQANIQFLIGWTKRLLARDGLPIDPMDEDRIAQAVTTVMSLPKEDRRLAYLSQLFQQGDTAASARTSLKLRLKKWILDGPLAWCFDNEENTLDLNEYPNFGIDGTDFLENAECRGAFTELILHLIETQVMKDKRRTIIVMDEFWKYLADPVTAKYAFDKLKTIRKQNGIFVFATQSPEDVLKNERGSAFIDNSATKIYLPNPYAKESDYVEGFKTTKDEFSIIKKMDTQSRLAVIKQGPVSVLVRLDLGPFKKALKILSGNAGSVQFAEKLFNLVGEEPNEWIPYFLGEKSLPQEEGAA